MQQKLERYFQLCGNMLPAGMLFVVNLFCFFWAIHWGYEEGIIFHNLFLAFTAVTLLILFNFNLGKSLFFVIITLFAYIGLNTLKKTYGADTTTTIYYNNMIVFLSGNWLFFYLKQPQRFMSKQSFIYLLIIVIEYSVWEFLSNNNIHLYYNLYEINIVAWAIFVTWIVVCIVSAIKSGNFYDYSMMFVCFCLVLGVYFCTNPVGLSSFFMTGILIILVMNIYHLIYNYFFDELTGLYNKISYLRHAKLFPPKYSLGIISIDNFVNLSKGLTQKQKSELILLTATQIKENIPDIAMLYRYDRNKFVVVCEKITLKELRAILENIRRIIASAEFSLSSHISTIKITISGGVAEKRRIDASAKEVMLRANALMQETLKFSGNIISPILRSEKH